MGHDAHFLTRLDRFPPAHVSLALGLYREPAIVRAILKQGKVSEAAERVIIALDPNPLGDRIVVTRDGAFVTCLGPDMANGPWPIVTRAEVDIVLARYDRWRQRVEETGRRSQAEWRQILKRMAHGGHTLTREEFLIIKPLLELLPKETLKLCLTCWEGQYAVYETQKSMRRVTVPEAMLRNNWDITWQFLHAAAGLSAVSRPVASDMLDVIVDGVPSDPRIVFGVFSSGAFVGNLAGLARSVNAVARAGKMLLPALKLVIDDDAVDGHQLLTAACALASHAVLSSKFGAEALKALKPPASVREAEDERSKSVHLVRKQFHEVAEELLRDATVYETDLRRRAFALVSRGPLRGRFPSEQDLPAGLITPILANLDDPIYTQDAIDLAGRLTTRWASAAPEDLYFPAEYVTALRPRKFDPQWMRDWHDNARLGEEQSRPVSAAPKPGRNEPCSCGSGKKYKKCCGA